MEELLEILNDIHPDVDFETQEGLMDNAILDSMDIIRLVTEINDAYDINISAKYLLPENFNSVQAIYALIEKLKEE